MDQRDRERWGWWRLALLVGIVTMVGPCGYTFVVLNTIDCGGDPATCEPAVGAAARSTAVGHVAFLTLVVVGATATGAAVRRRLLTAPLWLWWILWIVPLVVVALGYEAARDAVDAQRDR